MRFLVFQHVPHEHLGRISTYCEKENIDLEIVELWKSHKIPNVTDFDGLIIMGGPMSVYDEESSYPTKLHELSTIRLAIRNKIPILGFCLGSQLLANALGASVYPNVINGQRVKEIGFFQVELTEEGRKDPLFSGLSSPLIVLQWHGDAFDIPNKAIKLATAPLCPNQAFRYDTAYGLLFHLEFTQEMVKNQLEIDRVWIHKDNELDEDEILKQALENDTLMEKQCQRLFYNFLKLINSRIREDEII
ncbi:MAG: type 1 glutamine amidotransferase [Candidatus Aenigmatarchaeota archaeon]